MKEGDRYGRLTVVSTFSRKTPSKSVSRKFKTRGMAECLCDCGRSTVAARSDLRNGHTNSCGCYKRDITIIKNTKHGLSKDRAYKLWSGMKARCTIPSASSYEYYGGRGIRLCDEWLNSPETFIKWAYSNGYAQGLEIDRIDNDGDYTPDNCRFIPHMINSQLSRVSRIKISQASKIKNHLTSGMTIRQVAEKTGTSYMSVWHIREGNSWKNAE